MTQSLVIVESPAKARTIAGYLGEGYVVESSIGHIRDLPKRAADIPAAYKKEKWARLGVNVDDGFAPLYIVDSEKKSHITKLKKLLKESDQLLLATDEDREGESIAWHLLEVLKPKVPVKRMVFHEITPKAIKAAIANPRAIDTSLVNAQEARRVLDRLYGYEVSPVLWKKIMPRLSAGRVQSVATRVIVERERDRRRFVSAKYWGIDGIYAKGGTDEVPVSVAMVDGKRVATGKDFTEKGVLKNSDVKLLDEAAATRLKDALLATNAKVTSVERKPYKRSPAAPFMTSTLQQEAGRKLRYSSAQTMRAAQRLYEGGFITYMRTDSTTLSSTALTASRNIIKAKYGEAYLPDSPRTYKKKVKNAQEAHEAIRPAGDSFKSVEEVKAKVGHYEAKLYELIWKRTIASQMKDAIGERLSVKLEAQTPEGNAQLRASGNTITFPGYLRAYVEGSDNPDAELENRERHLPAMSEGDVLSAKELKPSPHETQPPSRYTEASLVRRLEELGVGRPSTYASIIGTVTDRGYVKKRGTALVPTFKAFAVVKLLEQHFGKLVDYAFTAKMEDELDAIARGESEKKPWLHGFYFGGAANDTTSNVTGIGLRDLVETQLGEIDARAINTIPVGEDENGVPIAVRVGRYGPYLQRGEDTASVPDDLPPDQLTLEKALELLALPSGDTELGNDPETGLMVLLRNGRFGTYVQLGEADSKSKEKPKTSSLLSTMDPTNVSLEDALKLLSLPRVVGTVDGEDITAHTGKYGPYIAKGKERRSLESDGQIFSLTVPEAVAILAKPKTRGRRAPAAPLKVIGKDPVSGGDITLRKGRFGPYVTDGETNASLRSSDDPETITVERAQELLQLRREKGPSKKKKKKKASKKKAKKKTSAKKKTKKKASKKKAAKKASASEAPPAG